MESISGRSLGPVLKGGVQGQAVWEITLTITSFLNRQMSEIKIPQDKETLGGFRNKSTKGHGPNGCIRIRPGVLG